jgi:hypothetical protein
VTKDDTCQNVDENATWQMSYQTLAYTAKPGFSSSNQTYAVYAGKPTSIDVMKRVGNVFATLSFEPTIGKPIKTTVPGDITANFRYTQTTELQNQIIYSYLFNIRSSIWIYRSEVRIPLFF